MSMPRRVRAKSDAQWGLHESDLFRHMLWMLLQWSHAKKGLLNGQCGGGGTNTATNNSVIIQIRVQDGLEKNVDLSLFVGCFPFVHGNLWIDSDRSELLRFIMCSDQVKTKQNKGVMNDLARSRNFGDFPMPRKRL